MLVTDVVGFVQRRTELSARVEFGGLQSYSGGYALCTLKPYASAQNPGVSPVDAGNHDGFPPSPSHTRL